jgi:hypothetical protein
VRLGALALLLEHRGSGLAFEAYLAVLGLLFAAAARCR